MIKAYILRQLLNSSTWLGIAIILADLCLPRTAIFILGLLLLVNDDTRLKEFFGGLLAWLAGFADKDKGDLT